MMNELMRGSRAESVHASEELRLLLPSFKASSQPLPQRCESCKRVYDTVITCQALRQIVYCGEVCSASNDASVYNKLT